MVGICPVRTFFQTGEHPELAEVEGAVFPPAGTRVVLGDVNVHAVVRDVTLVVKQDLVTVRVEMDEVGEGDTSV